MKKQLLLLLMPFLLAGCQGVKDGDLIYVEADEGKGFHFPYFLFIPDDMPRQATRCLVVEPNNSGFLDDDLQKHIEKAERTASKEFYTGNYVARNLKSPLLVPVFPRSKSTSQVYTHSLDRDVMEQKDNKLERIDIQLLRMVDDARDRLAEDQIKIRPQFLVTGFSASGTFANRFTLIHPQRVLAMAAGGLNGLLMLPLDELKGRPLIYPVGTHDFDSLFGQEFNAPAFKATPQFLYMGELDDNDAIPYSDAFSEDERTLIYELLDREMQPARWNTCREIYDRKGVQAEITTYTGVGHEQPDQVKKDIVTFFSKHIPQDGS